MTFKSSRSNIQQNKEESVKAGSSVVGNIPKYDSTGNLIDSGISISSISGDITQNVYYVSVNGNNTTGQKGSLLLPYAEIAFVMDLAVDNDVIYVLQGEYVESNIPIKSNITVYLEPGTIIEPVSNPEPIFSDLITGSTVGGATNFRIIGHGAKITNIDGSSDTDSNAIVASAPSSIFFIYGCFISSIETFGQSTINLKNVELGIGEIVSYAEGNLNCENCLFYNSDLHFYDNYQGNIYLKNCTFIRDFAITSVWGYLNTYNIIDYDSGSNNISDYNIIFEQCDFIQLVSGFPNITKTSREVDTDSNIHFYNCKFYNIDLAQYCIKFSDQIVGGTYVGTKGSPRWFMNNNISNVDIRNLNVNSPNQFITNELPTFALFVNVNFKLNN